MVPRSWVISAVIQSDEDYNEIIFTPRCLLRLFETEISKGCGLVLGIVPSHQSRSPGSVHPGGFEGVKEWPPLLTKLQRSCTAGGWLWSHCPVLVPFTAGPCLGHRGSPQFTQSLSCSNVYSIKHLSQSSALNHLSDPVRFCRWYNRAGWVLVGLFCCLFSFELPLRPLKTNAPESKFCIPFLMAFYTEGLRTGKLCICVCLSSNKEEDNFVVLSRRQSDEYLTSSDLSSLLYLLH